MEFAGDRVVALRRRLVATHGLVDAETAFEEVDDACLRELPAGDLQRVIGEREQTEAVLVQPTEGGVHLSVGRQNSGPETGPSWWRRRDNSDRATRRSTSCRRSTVRL